MVVGRKLKNNSTRTLGCRFGLAVHRMTRHVHNAVFLSTATDAFLDQFHVINTRAKAGTGISGGPAPGQGPPTPTYIAIGKSVSPPVRLFQRF
jgi:hypothetical protein